MEQTATGKLNKFRAKALLPLVMLLFLLTSNALAQRIIFCEAVDDKGKPSGSSTAFSMTDQGSFLNILVTMKAPVACNKVVYDVYRLDSAGKEKFESSNILAVEPEWTWFNKGFTFYQPGEYIVYVYNESEKLIVAGKLKLVNK